METPPLQKSQSKTAPNRNDAETCREPGHCPPDAAPDKLHQAMPPRLQRRIPPEAERRNFEDAVNGWWWL